MGVIEWGTVPQWLLAGAGAGWAIGWTVWEFVIHRKGKGYLVVTHDIKAVSGSNGHYMLMVNVVLRNPSRVRVKPESYTLTLWDIQDPRSPGRIPDTGHLVPLNRKKKDAVLEPGEEVTFPHPVPMPDMYGIFMVDTEIPDPQGDGLKWARKDVFEMNQGGKMTESRQENQRTIDLTADGGEKLSIDPTALRVPSIPDPSETPPSPGDTPSSPPSPPEDKK